MDTRRKNIAIEHIKNIVIAVLLITAVLLLSFFWKTSSLTGSIMNISRTLVQSDSSYMPQTMELISPEYIRVGIGSGSFLLCDTNEGISDLTDYSGYKKETLYSELLAYLNDYLSQDDVTTEEIQQDQYDTVMQYATVSTVFSFELPYTEFLKNNDMNVPQNGASIDTMTRITFSPFSSENVFVYDGDNGKYYRITTDNKEFAKTEADRLSSLVNALSAVAQANYYTVENVAGVENDTLIPIYMNSTLKDEHCSHSFSIRDQSDVSAMENLFFSGGMDFVRKITENKGALMYVQGYSEKVLQLNEDGSISYREEFDQSEYRELGLYDSITAAVEYVSHHGGWREIVSGGMKPYLESVERIRQDSGNYDGYRIVFGVKLNGTPVEYSEGDAITVSIYGDQVVSYERDVLSADEETGSTSDPADQWEAVAPMDIITTDYEVMCNEMKAYEIGQMSGTNEDTVKNDPEDAAETAVADDGKLEDFDYVMSKVDQVVLCMYRAEGSDDLTPCWLIRAEKCSFVYDARTGERVNSPTEDVSEVQDGLE